MIAEFWWSLATPTRLLPGCDGCLAVSMITFALAGYERAQTMTWKACAKAHLRVYQQVMEQAQK